MTNCSPDCAEINGGHCPGDSCVYRPDAAPPAPEIRTIGVTLASWQGGSIILGGFGCPTCGGGFFVETDVARAPRPGTRLWCPRCGTAATIAALDLAERGSNA